MWRRRERKPLTPHEFGRQRSGVLSGVAAGKNGAVFWSDGAECRVMSGCLGRVGDLGTAAPGTQWGFWIACLARQIPTGAPPALRSLRLLGADGQANHLAVLDTAPPANQREPHAWVANTSYKDFVLMELHRHDLALA